MPGIFTHENAGIKMLYGRQKRGNENEEESFETDGCSGAAYMPCDDNVCGGLGRLFGSFNCRGRQSIFRLGLHTNKYSLAAFVCGMVLLTAVLFLPFLQPLFAVSPLSLKQAGQILLLAFLPTMLIQIKRLLFS